jgi:acetyl-CoA carboxylase carboxyl transferase subunit alpha
MFEHSVYTVATPEACAAILWKDASKSPHAAEALKITAPDLKGLGIIDEILPEPIGGAHADPLKAAEILKTSLLQHLEDMSRLTSQQRQELRYQKFRMIGEFQEVAV